MKIGDLCIAWGGREEDETPEREKHYRHFGVVKAVNSRTVRIGLYDGSLIWRKREHVAVYTQAPKNWESLYRQQQVYHAPFTRK